MKCLMGEPAINALKKSDRDTKSTTGVPMVPAGLMFPEGRPEVTAGPMSGRCQITVPVVALGAEILFDAVTTIIIGPFWPPSTYSGCERTLATIGLSEVRTRTGLYA